MAAFRTTNFGGKSRSHGVPSHRYDRALREPEMNARSSMSNHGYRSALRTLIPSMLASALFASALSGQEPSLPPPVRIDSGVTGHIHPALCITKKGTLVAVYCKSEYQPYLITRSTDGGKTWAKPVLFPHTV